MEAIRNAIPETPVIVAGAVGGPSVMFAVTPFRNGLTLGATNTRAGAMELYGSVFARGLAGGWTGGIYPAIAGCPQFLCLGPAYHFYAAFVGTAGGVVLTSLTESGIVFGAETCNAQMAKNAKAPGSIKNVHNSMKPWGTGFSIHFARKRLRGVPLRARAPALRLHRHHPGAGGPALGGATRQSGAVSEGPVPVARD
ncbi:unnamed protein product [Prorocentrum cordatum]|uniref:Uncharacterized protein n=1 Tax=Prorocentrum cordatum TaxID=2364126 RepID=A0ABN9REE2_9DINO|nr:unnamed protein product [Polarella glacialis]